MLDANIKTQLKAYLEKLQTPIELVASLDDSAPAQEMLGLLQDIAELSDMVGLRENGNARCALRSPSAVRAKRHASALPASRWAMSSPR